MTAPIIPVERRKPTQAELVEMIKESVETHKELLESLKTK